MLIEVTEEDIRAGWDWSAYRLLQKQYKSQAEAERILDRRCENCPVALAMTRATGQKCVAETYRLYVGGIVFRCPEVVSDWTYQFDQNFEMKPFSFELNLDDPNRGYDPTDVFPPGNSTVQV